MLGESENLTVTVVIMNLCSIYFCHKWKHELAGLKVVGIHHVTVEGVNINASYLRDPGIKSQPRDLLS
jgi:hypothetical protein